MKNGTIGDYAQKIINNIIIALAIYDFMKKRHENKLDIKRFKTENAELAPYMGFLPIETDGMLDMESFLVMFSGRSLKEAISLLDEPIIKDALLREYERIFK